MRHPAPHPESRTEKGLVGYQGVAAAVTATSHRDLGSLLWVYPRERLISGKMLNYLAQTHKQCSAERRLTRKKITKTQRLCDEDKR